MELKEIVSGGIRSVAASFPIAASLATAWSEYDSNRKQESVNKYFEHLKSEFERLESHISEADMSKPENARLLEMTCQAAQDEILQEKISIYARFYAKSLTEQFANRTDKESVLTVLKMLSVHQMLALKQVANMVPDSQRKLKGQNFKDNEIQYIYSDVLINLLSQVPSVDGDSISTDIYFLIAMGCIETQGNRGYSQVGGKAGVMGLRPTDLGSSVIEYLDAEVKNT